MTENETFLPKISRKKLEELTDPWDYFYAILDLYFDEMDDKWDDYVWERVNDDQAVLLIYRNLSAQVSNWWFVQMIYNWYWYSVFETIFMDLIKQTWLEKTFEVLTEAKKYYEKYKEKFENVDREDWDAFSNLYKECPEFEKIDDKFYKIWDSDANILLKYVKENISNYVILTD